MDVLSIQRRYDKESSIVSGHILRYSLFVLIGYSKAVPVESVVLLVELTKSEGLHAEVESAQEVRQHVHVEVQVFDYGVYRRIVIKFILEFIESSDVIQNLMVVFLAGEIKKGQVKLFSSEIIVLNVLILSDSLGCSSKYIFQLVFL